MSSKSLAILDFQPDLRSAKGGTLIQRGVLIRLSRIIILVILDIVSLAFAWKLAVDYGTSIESPWTKSISFFLLTVTTEISIIAARGLYKPGTSRRDYLGLIKAISLSEIILLLIAFLYAPNNYISRSSFLLSWLLSIVFISTERFLFDLTTKNLRANGIVRYPVFLITDRENRDGNIKLIERENCYKIMGISDSKCLDRANREETLDNLKKLGIVEIFVSWSSIKNRLYIWWHFHTAGMILRIMPDNSQVLHPKSEFQMIGDVPCLTISSSFIIGGGFWIKRCFDLFASGILITLFSPIYIVIAILIKLDSPGPIFFRQNRVGLHSQEFKMWKFRTMVVNAEKLQAKLEEQNETKDGVLFKLKDDPRITPLGKFLRRYSLDELPQLFNVLFGEMSLVGPRPLPLRDVERFKSNYFIRQEVLPGITGLWQVSGRSDIDNFEDAFKLDISYIENWSFWMDFLILLKTVKVVFNKTGAY
jgi:exopolysaccharide biosynthesis polyprenyl glycosylphosphotransferase